MRVMGDLNPNQRIKTTLRILNQFMTKLKNTPLKQIIELSKILEPKQYHDPELADMFIRFVKYSIKNA